MPPFAPKRRIRIPDCAVVLLAGALLGGCLTKIDETLIREDLHRADLVAVDQRLDGAPDRAPGEPRAEARVDQLKADQPGDRPIDLGQADLGSCTSNCVTTIAGNGTAGHLNGPALSGMLHRPYGIAVGQNDTLYTGDEYNFRVRLLWNGNLYTVAGTGTSGYLDGPAASAQFSGIRGLAVDNAGRAYLSDSDNNRIRVIDNGTVSTVAGNGTAGFADGPAATAQFKYPRGIHVDTSGKIYVADFNNNRIRMISGGQVTTVAGDGVIGTADGPAAAARFNGPRDVVVDSAGAVFVADSENNLIRKIENGTVTIYAGTGMAGAYDGPVAVASFTKPYAVEGTAAGLYVAEGNRIRLIAGGKVTTVAGSGAPGLADGPAPSALFNEPKSLAVDHGTILIADHANNVIRRYLP